MLDGSRFIAAAKISSERFRQSERVLSIAPLRAASLSASHAVSLYAGSPPSVTTSTRSGDSVASIVASAIALRVSAGVARY